MELDDLKYQLIDKLGTDQSGRSDADIAALMSKRTVSITDRLQRNLWFELIFGIAGVLVFGWLGFTSSMHSFRIYFSVFAVVLLPVLAGLFYLLRRIKKLSATALPVKSNLQTMVKLIEEFIRRYFQLTIAMVPVCFVFALLLLAYNGRPDSSNGHFTKGWLFTAAWQVFLFAGVYFVVLLVGVYYFTRFYLQKLYGKYVTRLKACIAELSD